MATRYFKKYSPNVKLFIKCIGTPIRFETIGDFGYIRSDNDQIAENPAILAEFDSSLRTGVGGLMEITAAQYDAAIKKKELNLPSAQSRRHFREEIAAPRPFDTLGVRVSEPVAAVDPAPAATRESVSSPQVRSLRERANLGSR